jgi:selenocysteine-specific elongation factor
MAQVVFFSGSASAVVAKGPLDVVQQASAFSFDHEYSFLEELTGAPLWSCGLLRASLLTMHRRAGSVAADGGGDGNVAPPPQWALLTFETPVLAPRNARFIGSRLDLESNNSTCRLALHGCLAASIDTRDSGALKRLRVVKLKRREGTVERCVLCAWHGAIWWARWALTCFALRPSRWNDAYTAIGRGMFKKESDMASFENLKVLTGAGDVGVLQGAFGKSGKYKVHFSAGVAEEARADPASPAHKLQLTFKRYVFDKTCPRLQ